MKKTYVTPNFNAELISSEDIMSLSANSGSANGSEPTLDYADILNGMYGA